MSDIPVMHVSTSKQLPTRFVVIQDGKEYCYIPEPVLCKDCECFNDVHGKCHRTATIIDVDGYVYLSDEENGYLSMTDADPDGFCSWGVRKDQ